MRSNPQSRLRLRGAISLGFEGQAVIGCAVAEGTSDEVDKVGHE